MIPNIPRIPPPPPRPKGVDWNSDVPPGLPPFRDVDFGVSLYGSPVAGYCALAFFIIGSLVGIVALLWR